MTDSHPDSAQNHAPEPTFNIAGYEGFERIGSGGFSSVYRARQTSFGREVAVKVLSSGFATDSDRRTFERECHAMGLLSRHPNIVTVHSEAFTDGGQPCIVMELYRWNYRDRLDEHGPLAVSELLVLGIKIAGALQSAHDAGVLHRDLKPHNLFMSDYGEPALGDFGISTIGDERSITGTGGLSVAYAAPEVLEEAQTGAAADVYSLAATLFHLLDDAAPFAAPNIRASVKRILTEPAPSPQRSDVPRALCIELQRALSKRPAERHESALAFAQALRSVQAEIGLDRTTIPLANDRLIDEVSAEVSSVTAAELPSYEFGNARLDPAPTDTIDHLPADGGAPSRSTPTTGKKGSVPAEGRDSTAADRRRRGGTQAPSGLRQRSSPVPPPIAASMERPAGAPASVGERTVSRSEALEQFGRLPEVSDRSAADNDLPAEPSRTRRRVALGLGAAAVVAIGALLVVSRGSDDGETVTTTTIGVPERPDDEFLAIALPPSRIRITVDDAGNATIDFNEADNAVSYLATAVEPSARAGQTVEGASPPLATGLSISDAPCWVVQSSSEGRGLGRRSGVVCSADG